MFGKNELIGKKWFNKANELADMPQLFVTSIFYTFQGEGPFSGQPAVFIRLAKCNLNCSFCDAYFDDGDWMDFDAIKAALLAAVAKTVKVEGAELTTFARRRVGLVVTGGEPMLQDQIAAFFAETRHDWAWQQIETNGTQNLSDLPSNVEVVVSPKCAEKGGVATKYLQPHASVAQGADCLKFVVSSNPDSPYHDIPDWVKAMAKKGKPVYISPMNVYKKLPAKAQSIEFKGKASLSQRSTVDEVVSFWDEDLLDRNANRANHEYAARLCVENGYLFNLQGHLYGSMA